MYKIEGLGKNRIKNMCRVQTKIISLPRNKVWGCTPSALISWEIVELHWDSFASYVTIYSNEEIANLLIYKSVYILLQVLSDIKNIGFQG